MTEITLRPETIEQIVVHGDLSRLSSEERLMYINKTCERIGLDPIAKPFELLRLNGKVTLYATKSCTDQLRALHKISVSEPTTELIKDIYTAKVVLTDPEGRTDSDMGSVCIANLVGEKLSNSMMKAVTKAKRRATLSFCGLGMLCDEEIDTVPGAKRITEEELQVTHSDERVIESDSWIDSVQVGSEVAINMTAIDSVEPVSVLRSGKKIKWYVIHLDHERYKECTTFSETICSVCNDADAVNILAECQLTSKGNKVLKIKQCEPVLIPDAEGGE